MSLHGLDVMLQSRRDTWVVAALVITAASEYESASKVCIRSWATACKIFHQGLVVTKSLVTYVK